MKTSFERDFDIIAFIDAWNAVDPGMFIWALSLLDCGQVRLKITGVMCKLWRWVSKLMAA